MKDISSGVSFCFPAVVKTDSSKLIGVEALPPFNTLWLSQILLLIDALVQSNRADNTAIRVPVLDE